MIRRLLLTACLILSASGGPAAGKALHWARLDVDARLDRDGRLHVAERHAMVFTGDWNGGERSFNLRLGQELNLGQVSRVDSTGAVRPLQQGDLSGVDQWSWHDSTTLRWRSRLPSDPPFDNSELVYLIEYSLANILRFDGDRYLLDHDFAFPDRDGVIEQFTLKLDLEGAWAAMVENPGEFERTNLPPGSSFVVRVPLRYLGTGRPSSVSFGANPRLGYAVAALFAITALAFLFSFYRNEKRAGRFEPLIPPEQIDETWLEQNIFKHPPEVVGAAWDDRTSAAEVAAVLARMTAEGKLASRVEKAGFLRGDQLHLTLLADRDQLKGYEAALVKSLFFAGDRTSTKLIREHYKKRGFNPVSKIEGPVKRLARSLGGERRKARYRSWKPILLTLPVAIAFLVASGFAADQNIVGAAVGPSLIFVIAIFGIIGTAIYHQRVSNLVLRSLAFLVPLIILTAAVIAFLIIAPKMIPLSLLLLIGIALFALTAVMLVLHLAEGGEVGQRLEVRRRLASARNYFRQQLRRRDPNLRDDWFPYLLAFGLGPHIDRWFRAFGGTVSSHSISGVSRSSASSASSSGSGWSGGGGAFGGAGASGSWALAAGALAAGVSTPGSSGGGGGGGGGGSSGGGGGGGW